MTQTSLAQNSYENSIQSTGNERSVEYHAFANITRQLASAEVNSPDYYPKLFDALYKNLRLWTLLASDVANDNNGLPVDLRSNIFYLAEFTRHHSAKVYAGEADPKVLVDINTSIMRGLRGTMPIEGQE